jgi:hypothetical protein
MILYTFMPTGRLARWVQGLSKGVKVSLCLATYLTWLLTDVYLVLYSPDSGAMYETHRFETILSLSLSYVYQVLPLSLLLLLII